MITRVPMSLLHTSIPVQGIRLNWLSGCLVATVYAEIFVVLKFSWVPSIMKIKPTKILPPQIIIARRYVPVMSDIPVRPSLRTCHARIAFFWTQHPSFHQANCQGGKIFMVANFSGWLQPQNLNPTKYFTHKNFCVYGSYLEHLSVLNVVILIMSGLACANFSYFDEKLINIQHCCILHLAWPLGGKYLCHAKACR